MMSNGYLLGDANSLAYAYRSGGPELLDEYRRIAASQYREFAITETVRGEIEKGPLGSDLRQEMAKRPPFPGCLGDDLMIGGLSKGGLRG
jgi:hypothetical protein